MAKTPEQKEASKARKRQLYVTALVIARDLLQQADVTFVWNAIDTHFDRLGGKKPQEKSLYLDIKISIHSFLKTLIPMKRKSEQRDAIETEIARMGA